MAALDTNILVRYLVQDDAQQLSATKKLIRAVKAAYRAAKHGNRWTPKHEKSPLFAQRALYILVGPAGVEPTTNGLKVRCSTS